MLGLVDREVRRALDSPSVNERARVLLASAVVLVGIVILVSVIEWVEFKPASPLPALRVREQAEGSGASTDVTAGTRMSRLIGLLTLSLLVATAVLLIIFPALRKTFFKRFIIAAVIGMIILFIASRISLDPREEEEARELPNFQEMPDLPERVQQRRQEDFEAEPSESLVIIASVIIVLGFGVGAFFVWRRIRARFRRSDLKALSQTAQEAAERLAAGQDRKNTVIRCYQEMTDILAMERGIRRKRDMTPREFERQLLAAGLPAQEVDQLTHLFERVRYGAEDLDRKEEQDAVACLTAIAQACSTP